jgi:ubiquinone/menaquinone biosynthesis C-methylase UbiE
MANIKSPQHIIDQYADQYQHKYMNVDLYSEDFDVFCESIDIDDSDILDIACGSGNITQYLLNKRPDFKILRLDIEFKMIDLTRVDITLTNFKVMDCKDIDQIDVSCDGIMCGFYLPYLSKQKTQKPFTDEAKLLKPGGIFYISTIQGDYQDSGSQEPSSGEGDALQVYYYQISYVFKLFSAAGFQSIYTQQIQQDKFVYLVMILQKNV